MIVKLSAPLKDYVWGGTKLKTDYGKISPTNVAESWELSFVPDNESIVASGEDAGKPITQVVTAEDLGRNCTRFSVFPTLVKLINAEKDLSVQVHPSDAYALKHENQLGKTEMWHILEADEGAKIYLGLNKPVSKQQFREAVEQKTVLKLLNKVPVCPGETYFVPSGTLHAIGAGVTLAEIQQNSTLTYRVYDYDRLVNGKPRELHLEKALDVINFKKHTILNPKRDCFLGGCDYFSAYRYNGERTYRNDKSFSSFTVVEGSISLNGLDLSKGQTAFVSAGEQVEVRGDGSYIVTTLG